MRERSLLPIRALSVLLFIVMITVPFVDIASARIENVQKSFTMLEIPDSTEEGFEPHIIAAPSIDGQQWYYVDSPTGLGNTAGQGGNLWISKDYGLTWTWYDKDMAGGTGRSGDSYTAVSEDGTIYYTDLYLSTASVDFSMDGGETWIQNPGASIYVVVDRQWLMIGPDGSGGHWLYFSFNELATGLQMVKSRMTGGAAIDWIPCNNGLPISTDVGSRDNFVVDQNSGVIYHSNWQSDGLFCYVSSDTGDSWSAHEVWPEPTHAKVQNTFVEVDTDTAGNIYMMWSSREHIMLGISRDEGRTWDVSEVTETNGTRVFPWIAAGDEGRIAMTWYETNQSGNPNNLDNATWDYLMAISVNALDTDPLYEVVNLDPGAHYGSVRTSGLDGNDDNEPDRDLGDYIGLDIDEFGRAITVWGHDGDDGVNARQLPILFARQDEGPFLFDIGLEANFTYTTDGLTLNVDASIAQEQSRNEIQAYEWDFGDNGSGEDVVTKHKYKQPGKYTVTLRVTNLLNQSDTLSLNVWIQEKSEDEFPTVPLMIGALIILAVVALIIIKSMMGGGAAVEVVDEGTDTEQ